MKGTGFHDVLQQLSIHKIRNVECFATDSMINTTVNDTMINKRNLLVT